MLTASKLQSRATTPVIHLELGTHKSSPDSVATILACRCQKHFMAIGANLRGSVSSEDDTVRIEYKGKNYKTLVSGTGMFHIVRKIIGGEEKLVMQKEKTYCCSMCDTSTSQFFANFQW